MEQTGLSDDRRSFTIVVSRQDAVQFKPRDRERAFRSHVDPSRLPTMRSLETTSGTEPKERQMKQHTQKVALVTGASRGIGSSVAECLARDGFTLVINYAESAAPAEALVRKIEQAGGRALAAKADISDPGSVRRMFDAAEAAFGGIDAGCEICGQKEED